MEQFGNVKYALLCKVQGDQTQTHRGTGFVRFENKEDAATLLELSTSLQQRIAEENAKQDS